MQVIGIDCATDPKKTGISFGIYLNGKMELKEVTIGNNNISIAEIIYNWIDLDKKLLIAIDAPLGWPKGMSDMLCSHNAGDNINLSSNDLFRRETDKFVKKKIGKQPLDVGADRIARTALSALKIINDLSHLIKKPIKLGWDNLNFNEVYCIEVYPAATLDCYGIVSRSYKDKKHNLIRKEIIHKLKNHLNISEGISIIEENADALDSTVCLLSAKDFIEGNVYYPVYEDLAKKEGWIWVRR